jgi:hypothetical protein
MKRDLKPLHPQPTMSFDDTMRLAVRVRPMPKPVAKAKPKK